MVLTHSSTSFSLSHTHNITHSSTSHIVQQIQPTVGTQKPRLQSQGVKLLQLFRNTLFKV